VNRRAHDEAEGDDEGEACDGPPPPTSRTPHVARASTVWWIGFRFGGLGPTGRLVDREERPRHEEDLREHGADHVAKYLDPGESGYGRYPKQPQPKPESAGERHPSDLPHSDRGRTRSLTSIVTPAVPHRPRVRRSTPPRRLTTTNRVAHGAARIASDIDVHLNNRKYLTNAPEHRRERARN